MLWQPWCAEFYGVRPWEMRDLRPSEWTLMVDEAKRRDAAAKKQQRGGR